LLKKKQIKQKAKLFLSCGLGLALTIMRNKFQSGVFTFTIKLITISAAQNVPRQHYLKFCL